MLKNTIREIDRKENINIMPKTTKLTPEQQPKVIESSSTKKLTPKQEKFVEVYLETGNASESARQAYNCETDGSARAVGCENLTKPNVILAIDQKKKDLRQRFEEESHRAMEVMIELMNGAKSEKVRQDAAKDILDRAGHKPSETSPVTVNVGRFEEVAKRARLIATAHESDDKPEDKEDS